MSLQLLPSGLPKTVWVLALGMMCVLGVVLLCAPPAFAKPQTTITVNTAADNGPGNCTSTCTLRDAIAVANSGDTINFNGSYTIALASTLTINKNLTLDGTGRAVSVSGDLAVRVMDIMTGTLVTLNHLTIAYGFMPDGGGINNFGTLTVQASTFITNLMAINNHAGATLTVNQSTFAYNLYTNSYAGGIYNQGTVTVTNSSFSRNQANLGSAIANETGKATIIASSFDSNTGQFMGGAVTNLSGEMIVDSCTFTNNSQPYGYFGGGALWNHLGNLTVTNSIFTGNISGASGAGYFGLGGAIASVGTLTVMGSTFDGNSAWGLGGAISHEVWNLGVSDTSSISLTNNTFRNNRAQQSGSLTPAGGAVFVIPPYGKSLNFTQTNNTFSANIASSGGTIAYKKESNEGTLTMNIYNNIFQGATGGNCAVVPSGGVPAPTPNAGNNLADDATCGDGFTNSSAIALDTFGNYGGSTQTFPLAYNSDAIDAADAAYCPATDQRGKTRDDLQCDVGAYEMQMSDRNTTKLAPTNAMMRTFGPPRAGIAVWAPGDTGAVTVTKVITWVMQPNNAIRAWWDITATQPGPWKVNLKLCYLDWTELNGLSSTNLHLWRYDGGTWTDMGKSSLNGNCVQANGITTSFSRWTLATGNPGNNPTAVTLSQFNARTPAFDLGAWLRKMLGR